MRGGNRRGIAGKDPPLVIFPPSGIVAGAARQFEIQAEDGIIQSVQVTGDAAGISRASPVC